LQKTTTTDAKLSTRQEKPPENMHFGGRLMTFPQLWCFFSFCNLLGNTGKAIFK
jgi:hypothetical protein